MMPDRARGRVDKRATGTRSIPHWQLGTQRAKGSRHAFHNALIADGAGKRMTQVTEYVHELVGFDIPEAEVVNMDHERHHVADA
jgi:hypothetical protein